ncbi:MAG: substrate-binding periplasmic protein [Campylobacterales bacterium]
MKIFLTLLLFVTFSTLHAKEVEVAFSRTTPPFVLVGGGGISYDIIKESLAYKNHSVKPVYVNIARGVEMFRNGAVDANSLLQDDGSVEGFYSDFFITYQNCVFTLKNSKVEIKNIEDIKNYHTIGFQNATEYLGSDFGKVAKSADAKYSELADQKKQVLMLFKNRTQAIVMDRQIFRYYRAMLESEGQIKDDKEVVENCLFEPSRYQVIFKDKEIRDDFNEGLKIIRKSGKYDKIIERYETLMFSEKHK